MSDPRSLLERERQRFTQTDGAFERLLGRRERKQRNRRIRAGALGVIVALATGLILVRSLASEGIPADPPIEPRPAAAAGKLAYLFEGDIYVAGSDGSNAVRIANGRPEEDCAGIGEYWTEGPMWSPDGRYLAFRYSDCSDPETGGRDVVISDAEGNVLATFPADGWEIAWSPDSTRVAVWDRFYDPPATIGVYGLDGARQTQLAMPSGWTSSGDVDPVWMPDGTSLLVEDVEVPLDGSTPQRLPQEDPRSDPDAISPDGSRVAYLDHWSLVVADADGSDAREVSGRNVLDPIWSPAGDRIAFVYSEKNVYESNELRVLDVATGEVTPLAGMGGSVEIWNVQFSPEGDRILFAKGGSLWSIGVDGSDARLVVAGAVHGDWSPIPADPPVETRPAASGTLSYALDGDIYIADPDGSNAVRIANGLPEEDCGGDGGEYLAWGAMWSPDGRYLAYRHDIDCSSSAPPWDVVISDAEGNVLAAFPAQGWQIAWSPDSRRVAVWDRLYDPPATIGVYGLDGAQQTQLAMPSGWSSDDNGDQDPVWMPDGTSLMVNGLEVPLDGGTPRQLPLPAPIWNWGISYSPDASRVAYVDEDMSLVVAAADGSDAREVVERNVQNAVWLPTGDRIAFASSEKELKSLELRVLDVATGEVTPLVDMGGYVETESIQFSPHGDRILFSSADRAGGAWGLWSIGVDGSHPRLVVAGTAQGDWSP